MPTVLVFWFWVLLLPLLPPFVSEPQTVPWASILIHGPLDICLDLLPAAPLPTHARTEGSTADPLGRGQIQVLTGQVLRFSGLQF